MTLKGIRVLDLAQVLAGPFGAAMLGDLGADVIKVEPLRGDESRHLRAGQEPGKEACDRATSDPRKTAKKPLDSALFVGANRNKRGIALDFKSPQGRDALSRLLRTADIVIDNMRNEAKSKLGIDYESLREINDNIISINISAFGTCGPYAGRGGIDPLAQALSGIMATTGHPNEPPLRVGSPIIDATTAHLVVIAALAALRRRDQGGGGELIELNLLDAAFNLQPTTMAQYLVCGHEPPAIGCNSDLMSPYGLFEAGDGRYWQLVALNQKFFINICNALDCTELIEDPRFLSNERRLLNNDALHAILSRLIGDLDSTELARRFAETDVLAAPVNSIAQAANDPQLKHNQMIEVVDHATLGAIRTGTSPIRFTRNPTAQETRPSPSLGQHTRSLLSELGYKEADILDLEEQGVILPSP